MTIFYADGNPTDAIAFRSSAISNLAPPNPIILTFPRVVAAQAVPRVTDTNATGTISGVMTNADGPLANARIMLMQDGNSRDDRVLSTTTDGTGNYSFTGLPAGNYIVVPFDPTGTYRSKVIHTVVGTVAGYDMPSLSGTLPAGRETYLYDAGLVATNPAGGAITWTLGAGSPPGLSINAVTGYLHGTATTQGSYTFDITVTDRLGRTATSTQTVAILTPNLALGPHRYWRVNVSANNGNTSFGAGADEIELRSNLGGADQTSAAAAGASASASSIINGSNTAAMAFSDNYGDRWLSAAGLPQWIRWDFGAGNAKEILQLGVAPPNTAMNAAPKNFTLESSDNGVDWLVAMTVTNQTTWTSGSTTLFNV